MTDQSTKRYVIKLASGSYYADGLSKKPTAWLDMETPLLMVHGKEVVQKDGSIKYDPKGFDQRAFHNVWKENDKTTGKLVTRESYTLMINSQNCIGAQVVEAPEDLETVLSWIYWPNPEGTLPGITVREALGLSIEDAQEILGPDIDAHKVDYGYYRDLAAMAGLAQDSGAELLFDIRNPDGSIFKRWRVTPQGRFVEAE